MSLVSIVGVILVSVIHATDALTL